MFAEIVSTNAPDVGQAIGVLVHAFAPNVSKEDVAIITALIPIIARILRKAIPDNLQTGNAGTVLKHIALEINPQSTPPSPSVTVTATTTAPKVLGA